MKTEVPDYDPNKPPLFDIHAIEKILPHRYPFLLLDKIIELTDKYVVAVKNVTYNEPFFQGHFPGNCVMPGVLQAEALAGLHRSGHSGRRLNFNVGPSVRLRLYQVLFFRPHHPIVEWAADLV